jgi:two-component system cell cycle response regulator
VVLPETPLSGAITFAERMRTAIGEYPFGDGTGKGTITVTASVGVAVFPAEGVGSVETLFGRADEALYRAKADGRNRVAT